MLGLFNEFFFILILNALKCYYKGKAWGCEKLLNAKVFFLKKIKKSRNLDWDIGTPQNLWVRDRYK